ncbi:MAG: 4Fe-4S dicluster domain-containing protein [Betaproteobacteria bacterium]|nr:4Fe-4S dicluster domain-containing protein [Betaproteobacteria bacterium]
MSAVPATSAGVDPSVPCAPEPGRVRPSVDPDRCEAKGDCVRVCPYGVFEIRPVDADVRAGMSWRGRLKSWVHGGRQAQVVAADRCHACGLCVRSCPEQAIRLLPAAT